MLSNARSFKYFFILFFILLFSSSGLFASDYYQIDFGTSCHSPAHFEGSTASVCSQVNDRRNLSYNVCLGGVTPNGQIVAGIQGQCLYQGGSHDGNVYQVLAPATAPIATCDSIGFNTVGSYIGGFCVIDNSGILQPSVTQCLSNDQSTVNIPTCTQTQCPDGSLIDPQLGQECPVNRLCWDGSFVSPNQSCPTPPFICPDGSQAATQQQCPSPDFQEHTCWNGSAIPLNSACPIKTGVLCSDGSTASGSVNCPTSTTTSTVCDDGTQVQDHSSCAAPNITNNNINDTATSTTTSTSTTTNNTNSTVETTSTTSTTNIDMDLNSVNSRLDKINNSIENLSKGTKGNGGSIYSKSGKTFGGATAAFMTAMGDSALMQSVSDVFNISVTQNTCPFWTLPAVMGLNSYVIDHHCQPFMDNVFLVISSVLLLVATMTSIRIMLAG